MSLALSSVKATRIRERRRNLGSEALAVGAPRGVEIDEDIVVGGNSRIEIRFV